MLIDLDGNGIAWSKFAAPHGRAHVADREWAAGRELDGRTWDEYPQEVSRG